MPSFVSARSVLRAVLALTAVLLAGTIVSADSLLTDLGRRALVVPWGELSVAAMTGLELGWARTPAVFIGIASVLTVPLLAQFLPLMRTLASPGRAAAGAEGRARAGALEQRSFLAPAWIEIDSRHGGRNLELTREMLRIGYGSDNDLPLPGEGHDSVHALIRRTPEAEFVVVDLSGDAGPGIAVNGYRLSSACLVDGDRIALGSYSMVFRRGTAATANPSI